MAHRNRLNEYFETLKRDGQVTSFEYEARGKDGAHFFAVESARIFRDPTSGEEVVDGVVEAATRRDQTQS